MGNAFSFFRLPVALLERPAFLLPALKEAQEPEPECEPARGEDSGRYLERILIDPGQEWVVPEYLRELGARMIFHADSVGGFFTWLGAILHAYGDANLLGFLWEVPSRADVVAHLERLPERAKRLGRARTAYCLAPSEVRALAAALKAAKEDGFKQLPAHLRMEEVGLYESLSAPAPEAGDIDLWLFSGGDAGELSLDDLPEQRGTPVIPRRRSFLDRLLFRP